MSPNAAEGTVVSSRQKIRQKTKEQKNSQLTLTLSGADVSGLARLTLATTPRHAAVSSPSFAWEARTRQSHLLPSALGVP